MTTHKNEHMQNKFFDTKSDIIWAFIGEFPTKIVHVTLWGKARCGYGYVLLTF